MESVPINDPTQSRHTLRWNAKCKSSGQLFQSRRNGGGSRPRFCSDDNVDARSGYINVQQSRIDLVLNRCPDGSSDTVEENLFVRFIFRGRSSWQSDFDCTWQCIAASLVEFEENFRIDTVIDLEEITIGNASNISSQFRHNQSDWLGQKQRVARLEFEYDFTTIAIDDFHLVAILNDICWWCNQYITILIIDFNAVGPVVLPHTSKWCQRNQVPGRIVVERIVNSFLQQLIVFDECDVGP